MKSEQSSETTLACDLTTFDSSKSKRHEALLGELLASIRSSQELSNGYEFSLSSAEDWYVKLAEWVTLERSCCPFLSFEQGFNQNGIWLRLTGDENAKEFLRTMLDSIVRHRQGAMLRPHQD